MVQKYNDDEEIVRVKAAPGKDVGAFENEGTTARFYNKRDASLKSEKFTVLLELTGTEGNESDERPGLDIVIVLDVSGSMRGKNLEHMKTASTFLVKKLSPIDRLSVVKFSNHAERLCPLTLMTQDAQSNIEGVVHALTAGGGTNMTAGLEEAVKVLNDRQFTEGRAVAIMFLSDGDPSRNMDGSHVAFGDIPVHTFGLGHDYHPKVLTSIAARSNGGTFNASDVDNPKTSNLSIAFAQCLGGLLSVVVKDLTMIITKINSTIEKVSVGNYPQTRDDPQGTVTIRFGNLYCRETRNILVNLVLDKVDKPKGTDILEFTYFYKRVVGEEEYDVPPVTITVSRTATPSGQEIPEVLNEMARQDTAEKMKDARILADNRNFDDAKGKLDDAKKDLERNELDQSDPLIAGLLAEVKQFKDLMATPDLYEKLGRAFAFASELSHALQRASARGDVSELRLFATKAMNQAVEQATEYEKNPNEYKVPTADDDLKERIVEQKEEEKKKKEEELKNNPFAAIVEALSTHLDDVIKSLTAIKELLNKTR